MEPFLGVVSVASPCTQSWESMLGNERVRHCGQCDKNVYTLDTLTPEEVRQLVVRTEGKICWRFFVRKDGTVLTRDCPSGIRRARRRLVTRLAGLCVLLLATTAGYLREAGWWDFSQVLGSLSNRIAERCKPEIEHLVSDQSPTGSSPRQHTLGIMRIEPSKKK